MKYLVYSIFLVIVVYLVYINFKNKQNKENFFSKVNLDKNLIVVMMDGTVGEEYKKTIETVCKSFVDNCTYTFNKDKVDNSKKINITFDKSLKTSKKIKDTNYLVIYESKYEKSYNKKFIKKWCSEKVKNKKNFVVVDYNSIYSNSSEILDNIESKFKINIPMKGMLKYTSMNNINVDDIKNIASNVSMNNLAKQFMNKI